MAETVRLNKVLRELNISIDRATDFLKEQGIEIEKSPNTKISEEVHTLLSNEFQTDANKKVASLEVSEAKQKEKEVLREQRERELEERQKEAAKKEEIFKATKVLSGPKQVGKIDLEPQKKAAKPEPAKEEAVKEVEKEKEPVEVKQPEAKKPETEKPEKKVEPKADSKEESVAVQDETLKTKYQKLTGPKIAGDKIDLSQFDKPKKAKEDKKADPKKEGTSNKKKRRRISKVGGPQASQGRTEGGKPADNRFKGKKPDQRRSILKEEPS